MSKFLDRLKAEQDRDWLYQQPVTAGPQKKVGPPGNQVLVTAQRPTYEAAPQLPLYTRLDAMGQRANNRTRAVLDMLIKIRDFTPDVAKALDNVVTLANPGYDLNVYFTNKVDKNGSPIHDDQGLQMVREFAVRMCSEYSGGWDEHAGQHSTLPGLNTFIDMIHANLFTLGAMAAEVELTPTLDDIVDVYPVNPAIVDFQPDPETHRLMPGLMISGPFRPLDPIRFRYIAKTPDVNQPGGRSPILSVLDTVFFQQQLMRELQSIAHMSNSPRLDISVLGEMAQNILTRTRPDLMQPGREAERAAFMDDFLTQIQSKINNLEVDDALVHWDSVSAQFIGPQGTAFPVKDLINAIDKMMISGVGQLPILLGRNEGASTTHATVQWQVFILQLAGYQRLSASLVGWALNLYLRIMGRPSYVAFEYQSHRTSDDLSDAQALQFNVAAYGSMVDRGWLDDDEAAIRLVGHPASGTPTLAEGESVIGVTGTVAPRSALIDDHWAGITEFSRQRYGTIDGARISLQERDQELPHWIQRSDLNTYHEYSRWRSMAISSRFDRAMFEAARLQTVSNPLDWLLSRLSVGDQDRAHLESAFITTAHTAASETISEQLRVLGHHKAVRVTDPALLDRLTGLARQHAGFVTNTYNADLKTRLTDLIAAQQQRDAVTADALRRLLTDAQAWEIDRNVWKAVQVAATTTSHEIWIVLREFFTHNDVKGQAEVFPYHSDHDECLLYINGNPYPSMRDLLARTNFPVHPECIHYARMVGSAETVGQLWTGETQTVPL